MKKTAPSALAKRKVATVTQSGSVQVFHTKKGWAVQKTGAEKAYQVFELKADAVSKARRYRTKGFDVFVFKENGGLAEIMLAPRT